MARAERLLGLRIFPGCNTQALSYSPLQPSATPRLLTSTFLKFHISRFEVIPYAVRTNLCFRVCARIARLRSMLSLVL